MLFILLSISLSSFSIAMSLSPFAREPVAAVPPRALGLPAAPVVADDPEALAVPALLVPEGGSEATPEFPIPFGLTELLRPALGELEGAPIVPVAPEPFPVKPAVGEPVVLPIPVVPAAGFPAAGFPAAELPMAGLARAGLFRLPAD